MLKGAVLPEMEEGDPEEDFELLDMLGQGAFGSVSKALHKKTGQLYAIKMLSATSLGQISSVKKQIQILRLCDDVHIVKYYGCYLKDNNLWIVLQYCHAGSIIDLLNITQKKLSQMEIASILQSVLHGLSYLHANKKVHRDIKAANILLNKEGIAKLADFGVSTQSMHTNAGHRSQVGSPYWMSPQVMKHSQYTYKTDIWSLGVTAIELAEGVVPNSHLKPLIAMWQLKDKPVQGFKQPKRWSHQFNSFIKDCLSISPQQRPQAKQLLNHPFIKNFSRGQNLVAQLVQHSLADIQQFRLGQQKQQSQSDLMEILNRSMNGDTKTIINPYTDRQDGTQQEIMDQGSMVINDVIQSSMIVNDQENTSMVANTNIEPSAPSFLNKYISNLKKDIIQTEQHRQQIKVKISKLDQICLQQLELVFQKHKTSVKQMLQPLENLQDQQLKKITSKLHQSQNILTFIKKFDKYPQEKEKQFCRSSTKKSQIAHHSTQTNGAGSGQIGSSIPLRDNFPRGVRSQQFNQRQFRTIQKHCFNSKSIISDMQNVKYSKDFNNQDSHNKARRFILTQPQDWAPPQTPWVLPQKKTAPPDPSVLRQQFLQDPDVKQSLLFLAQGKHYNYDRIAQSTLFHDEQWQEDTPDHSSVAVKSRPSRNNYSEKDYLLPKIQPQTHNKKSKNQIKQKNKKKKRLTSGQKRPLSKGNHGVKHK